MKRLLDRRFGPAIQFHTVTVPINELADNFTLYVCEWLPKGRSPAMVWDEANNCHVVFWPMTAEEFLSWGAMFMEHIHDAACGATVEDGNEFLCCYRDGNHREDWPGPAKAMFAALYISDDGGTTWLDKSGLQLKR